MATKARRSKARMSTALARSIVYRFLSRAVAYPTEVRRQELEEQILPVLEGIDTRSRELDDALAAAAAAVRRPLRELRRRHGEVFGLVVSADCPDYETAYSATDIFRQTQEMADVAGFYAAHGLRVGGEERERPDHITTELEFMSFLALKEAHALESLGESEVELCIETEQAFLRDHLGRWAGALGERMALIGGEGSPYAAVGSFLAAWVTNDCERLGVVPQDALAEPQLPPPGTEEAAVCGVEGEPALIPLEDVQEVPEP